MAIDNFLLAFIAEILEGIIDNRLHLEATVDTTWQEDVRLCLHPTNSGLPKAVGIAITVLPHVMGKGIKIRYQILTAVHKAFNNRINATNCCSTFEEFAANFVIKVDTFQELPLFLLCASCGTMATARFQASVVKTSKGKNVNIKFPLWRQSCSITPFKDDKETITIYSEMIKDRFITTQKHWHKFEVYGAKLDLTKADYVCLLAHDLIAQVV